MVERRQRSKGKRKLLGNHQRCWLWGRHLVLETLRARKWPILELCLANDLPGEELRAATELAGEGQVRLRIEPRTWLTHACHSAEHQGYLAKMPPFPYGRLDDVLQARSTVPLYIVCDAIQDPYNLGAILRSAEVFAVDAVFIGTHRQVPVSSMVARASAGAVNRVPIVQVADLLQLASSLSNVNVPLLGACAEGTESISEHDFCRPVAVVIGNEGEGISPELIRRCASLIRIPQFGAIGSLNAAAAAGIICYEVRRQRTERPMN